MLDDDGAIEIAPSCKVVIPVYKHNDRTGTDFLFFDSAILNLKKKGIFLNFEAALRNLSWAARNGQSSATSEPTQ